MKVYSYTVKAPMSKGKYYIKAFTKRQAISDAKKIWGSSLNISSFRWCKKGWRCKNV